jgi:hypothetical protein
MTFYQQARKLMRVRTYAIFLFLLLGAVLSMAGDNIARLFVRPCAEAPAYRQDVPTEVRERIDRLQAAGLLYCSPPLQGLATMSQPIYWGSDGLSSILFFQADDLASIGVTRYGFGSGPTGSAFVPGEPGASPPDGFREVMIGRPALANQAPDGSGYFYRVQGAPIGSDAAVSISLTGPATKTASGDRDVFRDIEMVWNRLRRRSAQEVGSTTVRTAIAILPGRWQPYMRRWVQPGLADASGQPSYRALVTAAPPEPTAYQVVSGLMGTTVWVAGVVTGTNPALAIVQPDGQSVSPFASALWDSTTTDQLQAHFAFAPISGGTPLTLRYWHEKERAAMREPDYEWPVTAP